MDHQEHKKWLKLTSIISIVIFIFGTATLVVTIHQSFSLSTASELAISVSGVLTFVIVCHTLYHIYYDIVLYYYSEEEVAIISHYFKLWEQASKIRTISFLLAALVFFILSLAQPDGFHSTYFGSLIGILILSFSGLAQHMISSKLNIIFEDCLTKCVHGINVNLNSTSGDTNSDRYRDSNRIGKIYDLERNDMNFHVNSKSSQN